MKEYYDRRAPEYDATTPDALGGRPAADLELLHEVVAALPPGRVLDVACGTGRTTRFLRGTIVALDQSRAMLDIARERLPHAELVQADVPPLPFVDGSFDRVFTSHFYSHLDSPDARRELRAEAARVAGELVVAEEAWRPGLPEERWEERPLRDGSTWQVFKRYYTAARLAAELEGEVLLDTPTFVLVRAVFT